MGSRTTHGRRAEDLLRGGLPEGLLRRLHSPIGLDIGALTPEEVAVAILAEIIATGRGRDHAVHPLRDTAGPVHASRGMDTAPDSWKVHPRWT
jgi:xanthine dehydrogenase accessory factor